MVALQHWASLGKNPPCATQLQWSDVRSYGAVSNGGKVANPNALGAELM